MSLPVLHDIGAAITTKNNLIADPGNGGTFQQNGSAYATASAGAGTYKLPDNGLPMYVQATGTATINSQAGVTVGVVYANQVALFLPTSATTWVVASHSGSYTDGVSTQGFINIPLTSLRHVSSGAVGNITANGGVLASDTTPTLTPVNGATDATQIVTWAASNNTVVMLQIPLPPDMDFVSATTGLHFKLSSGGTSNAVGFTVDYYFEGIGAAYSVASETNQTTTYTERTALVDSADLNSAAGAQTLTVLLTPVAHTTDTLRLKALWFEYKKSLLTS